MRYHKPDIIVILAVVVAIGIGISTTARAAGTGDGTAGAAVAGDTLEALHSVPCASCPTTQKGDEPRLVETTAYYFDWPNSLLDSSGAPDAAAPYYPTGVRYDIMFNKIRAVMRTGGSIYDVTLRLDNVRHPEFELDPYLSISLGSRW